MTCANTMLFAWLWLKVEDIVDNRRAVDQLRIEIADLKDKNAKMVDLMSANNVRKRR